MKLLKLTLALLLTFANTAIAQSLWQSTSLDTYINQITAHAGYRGEVTYRNFQFFAGYAEHRYSNAKDEWDRADQICQLAYFGLAISYSARTAGGVEVPLIDIENVKDRRNVLDAVKSYDPQKNNVRIFDSISCGSKDFYNFRVWSNVDPQVLLMIKENSQLREYRYKNHAQIIDIKQRDSSAKYLIIYRSGNGGIWNEEIHIIKGRIFKEMGN